MSHHLGGGFIHFARQGRNDIQLAKGCLFTLRREQAAMLGVFAPPGLFPPQHSDQAIQHQKAILIRHAQATGFVSVPVIGRRPTFAGYCRDF
ncbi:MAG TPA: hypothetical protein VMV78_03965 [Thiobacillus sp.]|nr:hypothetical protein [Thiobacillus sp.]